MRGNISTDLSAARCPLGIDGVELERCVSAIQREECGHPADSVVRSEMCGAAALCLR
jgi:hypothetical protein